MSYAAHPSELRWSFRRNIQRKPREISRNKMILFRPELGLPEAYIFHCTKEAFIFNIYISFLISCLVSADVLYVWSAYLKDDLPFSFRMKCWFLCCFTCGKEAIMVILFVFVLYMCFRYMYLRMVSKCCECSWWKNDSINTWSSFCVFPNVSYDMLFLVCITPSPPPPYSSYFYVGMSKKKCVHL